MTEATEDGVASETPVDEGRIERITPEGRPIFYSNITALGSTVWDFTMDFGMILDSSKSLMRFQDVARVVMSPQQALVFSEILSNHVRQYEEKFGRIPRSPEPFETAQAQESE